MNAAREKVDAEGVCRVCGIGGPEKLDAAHLWNRSQGGPGFDDPEAIVPLCSDIKGGFGHHQEYDRYELDLLPYLTVDEQVSLVRYAGSIERARDRARGAGRLKAARHPNHGPF